MKAINQKLYDAIEKQDAQEIKILLSQGANVNSREEWTRVTPLHSACMLGNLEIVALLLKNGAKINSIARSNYTPLAMSISNGKVDIANFLLENGANISIKPSYTTHLINAVHSKNIEMVKLIIGIQKNVNEVDSDKCPPILHSIIHGLDDVFLLLIQSGVDLNLKDRSGNTLAHRCCYVGATRFIKQLIELGINIEEEGYQRKTVMNLAVEHRNKELILFLIKKGTDVNHRAKYGKTPLLSAINEGEKEIIDILISAGAEKHGIGAFLQCVGCQEFDIVEYLIENNFNINEKSKYGENAAFQIRSIKMAELLINNGLDINVINKDKETPSAVAKLFNKKNVAEYLDEKSNDSTNKATKEYNERREKRIKEIIERNNHENPIS